MKNDKKKIDSNTNLITQEGLYNNYQDSFSEFVHNISKQILVTNGAINKKYIVFIFLT